MWQLVMQRTGGVGMQGMACLKAVRCQGAAGKGFWVWEQGRQLVIGFKCSLMCRAWPAGGWPGGALTRYLLVLSMTTPSSISLPRRDRVRIFFTSSITGSSRRLHLCGGDSTVCTA